MIKVTKWGTTADGFQTVNLPEYILIPETLWDPDPIDYERNIEKYVEDTYKTPIAEYIVYNSEYFANDNADGFSLLDVRNTKKIFERSAVMLQDRLNTIGDEKIEFVIEYLANLFEIETTVAERLLESANHAINFKDSM